VGDDRRWDLASFDGLEITIDPLQSDDKVYTLILKCETLPRDPVSGREQATISWECTFSRPEGRSDSDPTSPNAYRACVFVPWSHFKPTYRGRPNGHQPESLDLSDIRRVSIMIRRCVGWAACLIRHG
jgi:hypothetical protein